MEDHTIAERPEQAAGKASAVCGPRCAGCRYSRWMDMGDEGEMLRACVYLLLAGRRRPCPAGKDCTAYEPKKRAKSGIRFGRMWEKEAVG